MIIDFDDPTIITNDFQTVGSNGLIVGNNDLKSLVIKKSLVQKASVVMRAQPDTEPIIRIVWIRLTSICTMFLSVGIFRHNTIYLGMHNKA